MSSTPFLKISYIGSQTTIPGWPEHGTLAGLFDALSRWPLHPGMNFSKSSCFDPHPLRGPFRSPALKTIGKVWSSAEACVILRLLHTTSPAGGSALVDICTLTGLPQDVAKTAAKGLYYRGRVHSHGHGMGARWVIKERV